MGAWISNNFITISDKSYKAGAMLEFWGYKDIDDKFINDIVSDEKIKEIQISKELPDEAYEVIDSILAKKPELMFRIYGLYDEKKFDISFLERMSHLESLCIDCHLRACPEKIDFNILTRLNLKTLHLDAFDLRDYSFMQHLSPKLEELVISADTMGGAIQFDCKWLLRYTALNTLWLGKKAKKNIASLAQIQTLKSLSLRGIKLADFGFLKQMELEKLALLYNSNNELEDLGELTSLKELELWRISKLNNIDFISNLINLEVLRLQDLKHVTQLPDLSKLRNLRKIVLDNTGIDDEGLEETLNIKIERYNFKD